MDATLTTDKGTEKVEISHRTTTQTPDGLGVMRFTFVAAKEHSQFKRAAPYPMPSTHRQVVRYGTNERGQPYMEMFAEVIPVGVHGYVVDPSRPPVNLSVAATGVADGAKALVDAATEGERTRLDALSMPDLKTLAAERGVTLEKGWNKAQIVAAVLEAGAKK